MSFDAGAITGGLKFDISEWTSNVNKALSDAVNLGSFLTSIFEGIAASAAGIFASVAVEIGKMVTDTADRFAEVGRAAMNIGSSTEFISTLGEVAKASGVGIDQLSGSFRNLEKRAADALAGQVGAAKGFADVGIKAQELAGLMHEPEALFYRVAAGIASITDPALRTQAAMDLMGRSGTQMISLLSKGPDAIRQLQQEFASLGGSVTASQAQMGEQYELMAAKWATSWNSIKASVAMPFLDELNSHSAEINQGMEAIGASARTLASIITPMLEAALQGINLIDAAMNPILNGLQSLFGSVMPSVAGGGGSAGAGGDFGGPGAASSGGDFGGGVVQNFNVNVGPVDSERAAAQIANKLTPAIRNANLEQYKALNAAAKHSHVSRAIGGKPPVGYSGK